MTGKLYHETWTVAWNHSRTVPRLVPERSPRISPAFINFYGCCGQAAARRGRGQNLKIDLQKSPRFKDKKPTGRGKKLIFMSIKHSHSTYRDLFAVSKKRSNNWVKHDAWYCSSQDILKLFSLYSLHSLANYMFLINNFIIFVSNSQDLFVASSRVNGTALALWRAGKSITKWRWNLTNSE